MTPSWWMLALTLLAVPLVSAQQPKTQSDYFVKSLPGQPDGPLRKMHAGYAKPK
jgi:carboxypeptidase D